MYSYRIEKAIRAASLLHKEQVRKGPIPYPYISHLASVAMIVSEHTDDEDTVIAAYLHDTIEDTDYTAKELSADFGNKVRDIVLGVTEPSNEGGLSWKSRKSVYVKQLKDAPIGSLIISAADKIHNMRSAIESYYEKPSRFIRDFEGSLEERTVIYQEISNILNRRLENDIIHKFNHVFAEYKNFIEHAQKETKN